MWFVRSFLKFLFWRFSVFWRYLCMLLIQILCLLIGYWSFSKYLKLWFYILWVKCKSKFIIIVLDKSHLKSSQMVLMLIQMNQLSTCLVKRHNVHSRYFRVCVSVSVSQVSLNFFARDHCVERYYPTNLSGIKRTRKASLFLLQV